jgi:hypothetical protein
MSSDEVSDNTLGSVLDRDELDRAPGPWVRVDVNVPPEWAVEGASVEVEAPERAPCARCDGGGCDGCGRSGAVRLSPEPRDRTFELTLPSTLDRAVTVRVTKPFGEASDVALAFCALRPSETPSRCRKIARLAVVSPSRPDQALLRYAVPFVVAVITAVAWATCK